MLHKTRGIVLKTTNYGESSVVVQILTEKFGLQSYLINGVKKAKARVPMNQLQPLHLLDMVVYNKTGGTLQRVAEVKASPVLQTLPYDVVKSCIAIFLNEVLYKSVRQQSADDALFSYVFSAVEWLDGAEENVADFHLLFLIQLSRYLGFYPDKPDARSVYFDLQEGLFCSVKPAHTFYIPAEYSGDFQRMMKCRFENAASLKFSAETRRYLLYKLLDYYALHIEGFGDVKSHLILEEVLGK